MTTKRIKLLRKCLVGANPRPQNIGSVLDVDQQEAIGLLAVGYAKETKEDPTEVLKYEAVETRLPIGTKDLRSTDPAKNNDKLQLLLSGSIKEIEPQLEGLTADELVELRALEMASQKPRAGVIDAIEAFDLDEGEGDEGEGE